MLKIMLAKLAQAYMTVKELKKSKPQLAKEIAIAIFTAVVKKGSLLVT